MTSPSDMATVGTYPHADGAERAREHLNAAGVDTVEIEEVASDTWEVKVPADRRDEALGELKRMEQQIVRGFF